MRLQPYFTGSFFFRLLPRIFKIAPRLAPRISRQLQLTSFLQRRRLDTTHLTFLKYKPKGRNSKRAEEGKPATIFAQKVVYNPIVVTFDDQSFILVQPSDHQNFYDLMYCSSQFLGYLQQVNIPGFSCQISMINLKQHSAIINHT